MRYDRNNIKITFIDEPVFVIDKDTVFCTLKAKLVVPNPVGDNVPSNFNAIVYGKQFIVKAKAKCSTNDKFDLDRGKRIAMAKAENKIYAAAGLYLRDARKAFFLMSKASTDFILNARMYRRHNDDYIDTLSNPNNSDYIKDVKPLDGTCDINVNKEQA